MTKSKKYKVTLMKTYIVNSKTEQDAKEQAMLVWEAKNHPVNITVWTDEKKEEKKAGQKEA
jgi:hypothetical protein